MTPAIRLMLVDDHAMVRLGLVGVLEGEEDFEVVAQGEGGAAVLDLYRQHRPDVLLLDLRMPRVSGLEALQEVRAEFAEACVLMLTTSDLEEDVFHAIDAGASGYLLKSASGDELVKAVRLVFMGRRYLPEGFAARLADRSPRRVLTGRELEVLDLLRRGMSNKDIGVALGVSANTAKAHVKNLLVKLDAADRTEAVAMGYQRGILQTDSNP